MPVPLASLRPLASPGRSWPALLSALAQPSLGSHHRAGSETLRCSPHPHVHTTVDPGEQGPRLGAGRQGGKSRAAWEGAGAAPGGPRAGRRDGRRPPLEFHLSLRLCLSFRLPGPTVSIFACASVSVSPSLVLVTHCPGGSMGSRPLAVVGGGGGRN